jgi:hypothetical protein
LPTFDSEKPSRIAAATNLPNHAADWKKINPRPRNKAGAYNRQAKSGRSADAGKAVAKINGGAVRGERLGARRKSRLDAEAPLGDGAKRGVHLLVSVAEQIRKGMILSMEP